MPRVSKRRATRADANPLPKYISCKSQPGRRVRDPNHMPSALYEVDRVLCEMALCLEKAMAAKEACWAVLNRKRGG